MICIDTNIVISLLARRDHIVAERFRNALPLGIGVPVHVVSELWYGVWNSAKPQQNSERLSLFFSAPITILEFDSDDALEAGRIRAHLKRAGTPIGAYDLLIAAQARRRAAGLATLNASEFSLVPGLVVEDWAA